MFEHTHSGEYEEETRTVWRDSASPGVHSTGFQRATYNGAKEVPFAAHHAVHEEFGEDNLALSNYDVHTGWPAENERGVEQQKQQKRVYRRNERMGLRCGFWATLNMLG